MVPWPSATPGAASCLLPVCIHRLTADDGALMRATLATLGEAFDAIYTTAQPGASHLRRPLGNECFIALAGS